MEDPKKLRIEFSYDPATPLGQISKGMLVNTKQRFLHTLVYNNAIHNSQTTD
jgi:hypothetical protein